MEAANHAGLSNVLGSSRCIKCSGAYLSLLIPFALAGITLVAFLLLCKLTVTVGSINGLIFYANIIAVNRSIWTAKCPTIFIAWLNLDLGIETCFYDRIDTCTYVRAWLQFVFPLYMWVSYSWHNSHSQSLVWRMQLPLHAKFQSLHASVHLKSLLLTHTYSLPVAIYNYVVEIFTGSYGLHVYGI